MKNTINTIRVSEAAVGAVHVGAVPENVGRTCIENTERNGSFYNIDGKYLPKAQAFFARKVKLRKTLGNCGRCGMLNPSTTHKHCDKCRAFSASYRASKQIEPVTVDKRSLDAMERRIGALEHSLALLQINARLIYKRGYSKAHAAKNRVRYADAYPVISKQELATMNHAYDPK